MTRAATLAMFALLVAGCAAPPAPRNDLPLVHEVEAEFREPRGAVAYRITPTTQLQEFALSTDILWRSEGRQGICVSYHAERNWKTVVAATGGLVVASGKRWHVETVRWNSRSADQLLFTANASQPFVFYAGVDQDPQAPLNASFAAEPLAVAPPSCIRDVGDLDGGERTQATLATQVVDASYAWEDGPGSAFVAFTSVDHDVRLALGRGEAWQHRDEDAWNVHALKILDDATATLHVDMYRAGPDGYFVAMFTPLPSELMDALGEPFERIG